MARRIAHAEWTSEISKGRGEVSIAGERLGLAYTPGWLQEGAGTNPEELLAAAHAASFAMALQVAFSRAHHPAENIRVCAELHLDHREGTWTITRSDLEGEITLDEDPRTRDVFQSEFRHIVEDATANCPVSRALAGVEITVDAQPASSGRGAQSSPTQPGPADPRGEAVMRDGRQRRALEGQLVSRMREQARHRRGSSRGVHQAARVPPPAR
jgi:osmotically inducible protein OsmC